MNSRTQNILIAVLIVGLVSMTIAYAALTQVLNINAGAKVLNKSSSWNIHFTPITSGNAIVLNPTGYQSVASNTITLTNTTATLPVVSLRAPGDYAEFYFDVINEGEVTGYINVIDDITIPDGTASGMTSQQIAAIKNAISATLTDTQGNALQLNAALAKNQRLHLKVKIMLSSSLEELPSSEVTFSGITASIVYGQDEVANQGGGSGSGSGGNETPVTTYTYYGYGTISENPTEYDFDYEVYQVAGNNNACPSGYAYYEGDGEYSAGCYYVNDGYCDNGDYNSETGKCEGEGYYENVPFSNEWPYYVRNDGTIIETCGVFGSGQSDTVCIAYNSNEYTSDFEDVTTDTYNITTTSGLAATGLKGYSLAKAEEMLNKGATSCDVSNGSVRCEISAGDIFCEINEEGIVLCGDGGYTCSIDDDSNYGCY